MPARPRSKRSTPLSAPSAASTRSSVAPPPAAEARPKSARIVFWNAERLKYLDPSVALLRGLDADAILLCEVDLGMARSGNGHQIAELAAALRRRLRLRRRVRRARSRRRARARLARGREERRRAARRGDRRRAYPLDAPELVRLENSGRWFDGVFGERRVGTRIAVMAELRLAGGPVLLVSVHYESHTGPDDRLAQTRVMLDAIDAHAPQNAGADRRRLQHQHLRAFRSATQPELVAAALRDDPQRLILPDALRADVRGAEGARLRLGEPAIRWAQRRSGRGPTERRSRLTGASTGSFPAGSSAAMRR